MRTKVTYDGPDRSLITVDESHEVQASGDGFLWTGDSRHGTRPQALDRAIEVLSASSFQAPCG